MSIVLFLQRISLIGALWMIVLAVFWPHVKPRIYLVTKKLLSLLSKTFGIDDGHQSDISEARSKVLNSAHFKPISRRLNRLVSSKETPLRSLHRSVEGLGQSGISQKQEPSFARGGSGRFASSSSSEQLDHLVRGQHIAGTNINYRHQEQQSSTLLSIYTACIIVLVIYTLMKALGARLNGGTLNQNSFTNRSSRSKQDTKASLDKRKLARMSREERIRELIRQHGGKNVSTAIKFLATELEKEKKSLVKNLFQAGTFRCLCNCHHKGNTDDITSVREDVEESRQSFKNEDNQLRDETPIANTHKNRDQSTPKLSEQTDNQQFILRERKKPTKEVIKKSVTIG